LLHRCLLALAGSILALAVWSSSAAEPRTDGPTILVTASYPGADPQVVAETVAAPIEQQINGVERMVWIESESRDGSYTARCRFVRRADAKTAKVLVENRVRLAQPLLPEAVAQAGVTVRIVDVDKKPQQVAIALVDRGDRGHAALRRWAEDVSKRLVADGAAVKPELFPGPDEKRVFTNIDRDKAKQAGVSMTAVFDALQKAGPNPKLDTLKSLSVPSSGGTQIKLASFATFEEKLTPPLVYRVNLDPAVRITGQPLAGKSAAETAAKWLSIAKADLPDGFAVVNLTDK
jgi:multidrug efflux pump subunit AcrB